MLFPGLSPGFAGIPRPALWIAIAGATPFVVGALGVFANDAELADLARRALVIQGGLVLTFLGAVQWGIALVRAEELNWARLGWGAGAAAMAGLAQFMTPAPALILLIVGLWAAFVVDARAVAGGLLPGWYLALRRPLSAVAIVCLASGLWGAV